MVNLDVEVTDGQNEYRKDFAYCDIDFNDQVISDVVAERQSFSLK